MVRAFMKWYGEPIDDFNVRIPRTLPRYTPDDEIDRLFNAIENKKTHKGCIVRDSLLVALDLKTGLRRSEIADLEVKDIHPDFLFVRNGKGGKDRFMPLAPSIAQRLQNFTAKMDPDEKVFKLKAASISNKIRQFAKKAGLEGFHTHTMRHKFATDLVEKGANIKQVQMLMGHSNLATTDVYLSITDKSLRDAVNLLEPKLRLHEATSVPDAPLVTDPIAEDKGARLIRRMPGNPRLKELGPKIDEVFGSRIR
jgi:site-specific recombinase XerD